MHAAPLQQTPIFDLNIALSLYSRTLPAELFHQHLSLKPDVFTSYGDTVDMLTPQSDEIIWTIQSRHNVADNDFEAHFTYLENTLQKGRKEILLFIKQYRHELRGPYLSIGWGGLADSRYSGFLLSKQAIRLMKTYKADLNLNGYFIDKKEAPHVL